ncbi:MAG: HAMP domain-containing sensor histidine kinase [Patescibacteria group bacterium]
MLVLIAIPAFVITALGASVINFDQSVCEAINSTLLTQYKLVVEGILVVWMLYSFAHAWKYSTKDKRIQHSVVLGALLLFFTVFAGTEYFSSMTGIYEINLYSLFVLPIFLVVMVFAVTNLGLFNLRFLGTQILSYSLILMTGSQLFFVQDATHTTLAVITLAISMFFGVLLLQNAKKEEAARMKIEELAKELEKANDQQVILIHFITHQIKGFVAKSRNIFSMALEGDFGPVSDKLKPMMQAGFDSDTKGAATIQEILNAANIKSGKVEFHMALFDLRELIQEITHDLRPAAESKGLELIAELGDEVATVTGDRAQLVNVFKNLIDNSIKYTPKGSVSVGITLKPTEKKVLFTIQDTGVGITQDDMLNLFTEGGHGKDSTRINVESTGFGLYIVKNIVDAHKGRVWAKSEGEGKGSSFFVELPA